MDIKKIGGIISALTVIIGATYAIDGRWVQTKVYAEEICQIQMRQLKYEQRGIQQDIYDLEDRIANPRVPSDRKAVYRERLRKLLDSMKEIEDEKTILRKKGE